MHQSKTHRKHMRSLKSYTIPELITHLNWLGVEWVGSTTRKAPILATIERFSYNVDYLNSDKEAVITAKGLLDGSDCPICNLVGFIRYMGQIVTSEELADLETLLQRAKELAKNLINPPTTVPSQGQEVTQMDTERLLKVVERTASHGLAQPDRAKWMLIWACDICGELAEYIEEPSLEEAGDVLWGCGAISIITGVPLPRWLDKQSASPLAVLCMALKLLDHLKKVARDGLEHREVNEQLVRTTFATVLGYLKTQVNLDEAVSAVDIKLLKRYPDGYSADKSVNRVI